LLPDPEREPSGHRRYSEETVRFLRAIKEAQAVGFTLAEIADYLKASRRSTSPSEALRVRMAAKIDEAGAARTRAERPSVRLHVTNGESAGNTLRQTALGGAVLPWQDVLDEGPVPAVPRPELLRARAAFLADCGDSNRSSASPSRRRLPRCSPVSSSHLTSERAETVRGAYLVMPLGTTLGLFRHYWLLFKLLINVVTTIVLLLYMEIFRFIAEVAADPNADLNAVRNASPALHAGAAMLLLLVATTLAVYKPRGMTAYGRRKQREQHALLVR
jgi:DNA-binding transcriptional MerR regulator